MIKEEAKFIEEIKAYIDKDTHSTHSQYGIPIFWKICLDGSDQPKEIRDLALKSMLDMFKQGFRKTNRLFYLACGLNQFLQQKSIVQSAKVIKAVINSFNIDQS